MGKSPFSRISAKEHQMMTKDSFFVSNGPFSMRFKKTPQKRGLAVVISGKLVSRAVTRNRYRRLVREIFREESNKIPKDASCVVFIRQKMVSDNLASVKDFVKPLIAKAFPFEIEKK